ncbi:SDR family oxidoreductase [Massilia sp. erpn]|uniref:SDR family oxidoreductase n=1 Tax=Massilia sp. erpn TaxID=2738142 RepID=UPI0021082162|nr:SDR family oxidoreductase [Massilia sp. erpn]UTY57065.1 SDR family oxidoreductase [Massilia sp. erpn]
MSGARVVMVTGAAGSIGRAICQRFLADGADVLAIDINGAGLDALASQLQGGAARLTPLLADVTDPLQVQALVARAVEQHGAISVLINNAGGNRSTQLCHTTVADWQADVNLNLNAAYYLTSALLPHMAEQGGACIVNIGSVNGIHIYGDPGYSAAKAGLINFTQFVAVEYGNQGIRANIVCPGTVKTAAWNQILAEQPGFYENVQQLYANGQLCVPEDVAGPVFFLCSADARMINGATLVVDGGLTAGVPSIMKKFSKSERQRNEQI